MSKLLSGVFGMSLIAISTPPTVICVLLLLMSAFSAVSCADVSGIRCLLCAQWWRDLGPQQFGERPLVHLGPDVADLHGRVDPDLESVFLAVAEEGDVLADVLHRTAQPRAEDARHATRHAVELRQRRLV